MEVDKIKAIIEALEGTEITKFEYRNGEEKLKIRRGHEPVYTHVAAAPPPPPAAVAVAAPAAPTAPTAASTGGAAAPVAPGVIDTPQLQVDADAAGVALDEIHRRYAEAIPLARIGSADEVSAAVELLADFSVEAIVGQVISCNGGSTRTRV